jgi:hypothetical protein
MDKKRTGSGLIREVVQIKVRRNMMKAPYWQGMIAVVVLAGFLGGCGARAEGERLQGQLADAAKELEEYKTKLPPVQEELAECLEADRKLREEASATIDRLNKENAELEAKLGGQ